MTEEQFDIHEPYRCYVFMMLMFDCHNCKRYFEIDPAYGEPYGWEWFHNASDQAWRAGWYVAPKPSKRLVAALLPLPGVRREARLACTGLPPMKTLVRRVFCIQPKSPNHALQRTAPRVTAPASGLRLSPTVQAPRRAPQSLSLESLGVTAHVS